MNALYNVTKEECVTFLELCEKFGDDSELTAMKNMVARLESLCEDLNFGSLEKENEKLLDSIKLCHQREVFIFYGICQKIGKEKKNDIFKKKYEYKTCSGIFKRMRRELDLVLNLVYDYFGTPVQD